MFPYPILRCRVPEIDDIGVISECEYSCIGYIATQKILRPVRPCNGVEPGIIRSPSKAVNEDNALSGDQSIEAETKGGLGRQNDIGINEDNFYKTCH